MSALDSWQLKQLAEQRYELSKRQREAKQLEERRLITEAPEGYYYKGEDVEEYNRQAIEYNRQLNEYKRALARGESEQSLAEMQFKTYEIESQIYVQQYKEYLAKEPERRQFIEQYVIVGPPEPTATEKMRIEAGIPLEGLPGPGAGPKPGSFSAEIAQPLLYQGLKSTELPYRAVTDYLRETGAKFEEAGLELSGYEGGAVLGLGAYLGAKSLNVLAMGVDIATFGYRPGLWVDVARSVPTLIFDSEARGRFVGEAISDPFGFVTEYGVGAVVGGLLQGRSLSTQYGEIANIPSRYRQWRAAGEWERLGLTEEMFNPVESEMGMQYPAKTEPMSTYQGMQRKYLKISRGDLSLELPYYSKVEPLKTQPVEYVDVGEAWGPEKVVTGLDTAVGYGPLEGDGGFLKVKGAYGGMKPMPEIVEAPIMGRGGEISVLTTKGVPSTPVPSGAWVTPVVEPIFDIPTGIYPPGTVPGIRFRDILVPPTIRSVEFTGIVPTLGSGLANWMDAATKTMPQVSSLNAVDLAFKQVSPQMRLQDPLALPGVELSEINMPRLFEAQLPIDMQIPRMDQIDLQKSDLSLASLQLPDLMTPMPSPMPDFFWPPEPPRAPRTRVRPQPSEKKKRKKGRKRRTRGVYELRIDPIRDVVIKF